MKWIKQEYSRGNVGGYYYEDEMSVLNAIADAIIEELNNGKSIDDIDIDDLIEEFYDNTRGVGYRIEDDDTIVLYNKRLDKYGNSWGYCEVRIIPVEKTITDEIRELVEQYVDDNAEYEITIKGEGIRHLLIDDWDGKIVSGKELKEIVKNLCLALEEYYTNIGDEGLLYGYESCRVPVCSNNPYAYGGDSLEYEINKDEIIITYNYVWQFYENHLGESRFIATKLQSE